MVMPKSGSGQEWKRLPGGVVWYRLLCFFIARTNDAPHTGGLVATVRAAVSPISGPIRGDKWFRVALYVPISGYAWRPGL